MAEMVEVGLLVVSIIGLMALAVLAWNEPAILTAGAVAVAPLLVLARCSDTPPASGRG
jgi:hypothetical protein